MSCSNCGTVEINSDLQRIRDQARAQAKKTNRDQEIWKEYGHYRFGTAPQNVKIVDVITPYG